MQLGQNVSPWYRKKGERNISLGAFIVIHVDTSPYPLETLKQAQTRNKEFSINQVQYEFYQQDNYFNTNNKIACKVYYIELKYVKKLQNKNT